MKLKLEKIFKHDVLVNISADRYVCMDLEIRSDDSNPPPLYWRLVDDKFNLVTIGLDRVSGRFRTLTVVFYNGNFAKIDNNSFNIDSNLVDDGIPEFSLSPWGRSTDIYNISGEIFDVPGRCQLELGFDSLNIRLFQEEIIYSVTKPNVISCQFNKSSELCAVKIENLSNEVVGILNEYSLARENRGE